MYPYLHFRRAAAEHFPEAANYNLLQYRWRERQTNNQPRNFLPKPSFKARRR